MKTERKENVSAKYAQSFLPGFPSLLSDAGSHPECDSTESSTAGLNTSARTQENMRYTGVYRCMPLSCSLSAPFPAWTFCAFQGLFSQENIGSLSFQTLRQKAEKEEQSVAS